MIFFDKCWSSEKRGTFNEWKRAGITKIAREDIWKGREEANAINITRPCFGVRASG